MHLETLFLLSLSRIAGARTTHGHTRKRQPSLTDYDREPHPDMWNSLRSYVEKPHVRSVIAETSSDVSK